MKDKLVPLLVVLVVVAAFVVGMFYGKLQVYENGGAVAGTGNQEGSPDTGNQPAAQPTPVVLSDDAWNQITGSGAAGVKGEDGAPVKIVEFTDYQCPFCGRYTNETYPSIVEKYVDTGKVQYILRDLPLSFHPNAKPAALATRCAGDQGKYWEMHDLIFKNQEEWSEGDAKSVFAGYAAEIGLNVNEYNQCYDGDTHAEVIDADTALASTVGATGTPTFFINGKKLVGAQPLSAFEAVIEEALGN